MWFHQGFCAKLLLVFFVTVLYFSETLARGSFVTKSCLRNQHCTQCPENTLRRGTNGAIFCCENCSQPPFKTKDDDQCACLEGDQDFLRRSQPNKANTNKSSYTTGYPTKKHIRRYNKKKQEADVSSSAENSAIRSAITMMAEVIEKMDVRIRMIEEVLGQVNMMRFGDMRLPLRDLEREVKGSSECPHKFDRIGHKCIYISLKDNHRGNWKDAQQACKARGANLAETMSGNDFLHLSRHLTKNSLYKGYSYWLGGLYPGALWVWLSNGKEVTDNPTYWTVVRLRGGEDPPVPVRPGDISNGRCLALQFVLENAVYRFAGDECGFEKFFVCEATTKLQYTESEFD